MVRVYPKLKEYCQSIGYDFQVVDMRWGVRDEATADHMTSELCMKELKLCQDISTGPSFIVRIQLFVDFSILFIVSIHRDFSNFLFLYATGAFHFHFNIPYKPPLFFNSRLPFLCNSL